MRRAEKRGKELPPLLKAALEAQAKGKFLVTSTTDFQSAGFISRAPAEAYSIGYDEEMSATLRSGLIPDVIKSEIFVKGARPHNADEPQIWKKSDVSNTLNTFDIGENRCNELIVEPKAYGIYSKSSNSMKSSNPHSGIYEADTSKTLDCNGGNPTCNQGEIVVVEPTNNVKCLTPWDYQNKRVFDENGCYPCMSSGENSGADFTAVLTAETTYCIQGNTIERSDTAGANGKGVIEDQSYTLNTVDRHAVCHAVGFCPNNSSAAAGLSEEDEKSPTMSVTKNVAACYPINTQIVTRSNKLGEGTGMGIAEDGEPAYTLQEAHSHGVIYAIDRAAFNQGENAKYDFQIEDSGINSTIVARGPSAVCHNISQANDIGNYSFIWIVRRLTPLECERLQGFEDNWTLYDTNENELKDTPRYKALGNSIAIPCALRVFKGIIEAEAAG